MRAPQHRVSLSWLVAVAIVLGLVSCRGKGVGLFGVTPEADARARGFLSQLARGEVDSARARVDSALATTETRDALVKVAALAAKARFDSMHVIGYQVNSVGDMHHTNVSYECFTTPRWYAANVAWRDSAGVWSVDGVSVQPLAGKLETL